MSQLGALMILFLCFFFHVKAQDQSNSDPNPLHPLQPNLAVIIGVFSAVFSLLLLVLAYAKFCHTNPFHFMSPNGNAHHQSQTFHELIRSRSRSSGIDREVIESLPFFRFASLKGSKEGLECAVCISRFEDSEILRLLPKCKHAFHVKCIDQWLESHSSCPLCRYKFDMRDLRNFSYSNSLRFLGNPSNLTEDPHLELFVQTEQDRQGSSSFNIGSSFRKTDKAKKEELLIQEANRNSGDHQKLLHKFKHKIVVSDVVIKNRWSDVNASDLLLLNSEMIGAMSTNSISLANSTRFHNDLSTNENMVKTKEDIQMKRMYESKFSGIGRSDSVSASYNEANSSKVLNATEKRSMSEIINFARVREFSLRHKIKQASLGDTGKEERIRRIWLPIVQRTVQGFVGGERNLQELEKKRPALNV